MKKFVILFIFIYLNAFSIYSVFKNGELIPKKYTCDGKNISLPVKFINIPKYTKSIALIMQDPDAPFGVFTHWIILNVKNSLKENFPKKFKINDIYQGINDFGYVGYGGPCPPFNQKHRYIITAYALDTKIQISNPVNAKKFFNLIKSHITAKSSLLGFYQRSKN